MVVSPRASGLGELPRVCVRITVAASRTAQGQEIIQEDAAWIATLKMAALIEHRLRAAADGTDPAADDAERLYGCVASWIYQFLGPFLSLTRCALPERLDAALAILGDHEYDARVRER